MDATFLTLLNSTLPLVSHAPQNDLSAPLIVLFVLLARCGFVLTQLGLVPANSIEEVLLQHALGPGVSIVVFSTVGIIVALGRDVAGAIGVGDSMLIIPDPVPVLYALCAILLVSALLSSSTSHRTSLPACVILHVAISIVAWPLLIHWTHTPLGWASSSLFYNNLVTYKDYAHSGLVHMAGGFLTLAVLIVLGRRLVRVRDLDPATNQNPVLSFLGYLLLMVGLLGVLFPDIDNIRQHKGFDLAGLIFLNALLAWSGGVTSSSILLFSTSKETLNPWASLRGMQAGIAGIVIVSCGVDKFHPLVCLLLGFLNGLFFYPVAIALQRTFIEDTLNIIPTHLLSGFLSTLLAALHDERENYFPDFPMDFIGLVWQFLVDLAIISVIAVIFFPLLWLMEYFRMLRSVSDDINHRRATTIVGHKYSFNASFDRSPDGSPKPMSDGSSRRKSESKAVKLKSEEPEVEPERKSSEVGVRRSIRKPPGRIMKTVASTSV